MKIVIATPILYNSRSPFNHLFKDILGGFLAAGYEVIRYVAVRNDEEDEYKFGYDNIQYVKYRRKESAQSNIISRYLKDTYTNIREARDIKKSGADVLFEDVSYSSFWPVRAAKKKRMKVVAMIQDVWPDNAVQSGLIKQNGILYRYFDLIQRYVYQKADTIICISDDMKAFICSKGIDEAKIKVIYNWGYSDDIVNIKWENNQFVKKYGLEKEFYAVYAGNIGKMQNVELVLNAAKILPDVKFLIIGDGVNRSIIEEKAIKLSNVIMLPLQPPELAEHIYSMAGVNIIPLVEGGIKTAMPSKTGVILACGRPVICCFGNETCFAKIMKQYNEGVSVGTKDERELAQSIVAFKQAQAIDTERVLFRKLFLRSNNIAQYVDCI